MNSLLIRQCLSAGIRGNGENHVSSPTGEFFRAAGVAE